MAFSILDLPNLDNVILSVVWVRSRVSYPHYMYQDFIECDIAF